MSGAGAGAGARAEVEDSEDATQKDIDALKEISKNQEERIHNLETNALQVAGLYFVFQAVILKAVWSTTTLRCGDWWYAFVPSLLAALLNICSCIITVSKWLKYNKDFDQNHAELQKLMRQKLVKSPESGNVDSKIDSVNVLIREVLGYSALILFIAISVVILFSCHYVLCCRSKKLHCMQN